jgi:hypothetical protein
MQRLLERACEVIPAERLWVNPDCGLKTGGWPGTEAALANMIAAARTLRQKLEAQRNAAQRRKRCLIVLCGFFTPPASSSPAGFWACADSEVKCARTTRGSWCKSSAVAPL